MDKIKGFLAKYGVSLAFLGLAFGGGVAISSQDNSQRRQQTVAIDQQAREDAELLRRSQLEECQRDNAFRREDNKRGNVLRALLDKNAAIGTKDLPKVKIKNIPLTECHKAYPKP